MSHEKEMDHSCGDGNVYGGRNRTGHYGECFDGRINAVPSNVSAALMYGHPVYGPYIGGGCYIFN